jgi:biopolymer transport protein ExbB/TolQ
MTRTAPRTDRHLRSLWFGVLAGPITWTVHFLVGYGLVEVACRLRLLESQLLGLTALSVIILVLTLVALLVTLYAGFLAYRNWRRMQVERREGVKQRREAAERSDQRRLVEESGRFMAFGGVLLNGLFSFVILVTGIPVLILPPCG